MDFLDRIETQLNVFVLELIHEDGDRVQAVVRWWWMVTRSASQSRALVAHCPSAIPAVVDAMIGNRY